MPGVSWGMCSAMAASPCWVPTRNSLFETTEIAGRQLNPPVDAEESNDFSQVTHSLTL